MEPANENMPLPDFVTGATENDVFKKTVYEIVAAIPPGFVLTYGLLALLAGRPSNARMVGKFMSEAPRDIRSHRVVNHMGHTVLGWIEQRALLEADGVTFKKNGCVDLKKHLWRSES
jgi:methylated-DNA-protein-cysteine methyltransferase-like protein